MTIDAEQRKGEKKREKKKEGVCKAETMTMRFIDKVSTVTLFGEGYRGMVSGLTLQRMRSNRRR